MYMVKAKILEKIGFNKGAQKVYDKVISMNPENFEPYKLKAEIHQKQNEDELAIEVLESALKYNQNEYMCWYMYGLQLKRLKKFHEALEAFQNAEAIDTSKVQLHLQKCGALIALNMTTEALDEFDKSIELNPDDPILYCNKAILLFRMGKLDYSKVCCEEALKVAGEDSEGNNRRGSLFWKKSEVKPVTLQLMRMLKDLIILSQEKESAFDEYAQHQLKQELEEFD